MTGALKASAQNRASVWFRACRALALACVLLPLQPTPAQDTSGPEAEELSARIAERREAVQADAMLGESAKANALEALDNAEVFLAQAGDDRDLARQVREQRQAAPTLIAEAEEALAKPQQEPDLSTLGTLSDSELEIRISEAQAASQAASDRYKELQQNLTNLRAGRPTIGSDLAQAREELRSAQDTVAQITIASEARPGTGTSILRAEAQEQALMARIELLEARRNGIDVREKLLLVRSSLAERDSDLHAQHARSLRAIQAQLRQAELMRETKAEDRLLYDRYPPLLALAQSNEELASGQIGADSPRERAASGREELAAVEKKIVYLDGEREQLDAVLDSLGRTTAAEQLVYEALLSLRDFEAMPSATMLTEDAAAKLQIRLVKAKREQGELERDLSGEVDRFLDKLSSVAPEDAADVRARVEELLAERVKLLQQVARDSDDYLDVLTDLKTQRDSLATKTRNYGEYLQGRQVWVPNLKRATTHELFDGLRGLGAIFAPELWRGVPGMVVRWVRDNWIAATISMGLAVVSLLLAMRARAVTPRLIESARDRDGFHRLAQAILPSVVYAFGMAVAFMLAGWLLGAVEAANQESPYGLQALADVLPVVALSVFAIPLIRALFSPTGPVVQLQPESARGATLTFKSISRLIVLPVLIVGVFVLMVASFNKIDENADAAARSLLIAGFLIVASAVHVLLNPRSGLLGQPTESSSTRGYTWPAIVVYLLTMAIPALMIFAVLAGYVLGPFEATRALLGTAAVVSIFLATRAVLAGQSTQAEQAVRNSGVDLTQGRNRLAMTVTTIFLAGLFLWVWDEVLISLSYLQSVTLWFAETPDGVEPVTVADLLWFVLVLGGTLLSFWALPVVFGTRSLDPTTKGIGPRYAAVTLVRYTVLIAGVLAAFSALNVGWSRLQWMAAGLSVGLGFGLQESVANFIAGLMLLTEQQVRIGDVIEVGDKMGTVTRIQVRATTVRDFDGRELIIPNKELVTTQVTNYTLSDTRRRIQLVVGVAYGADTDLVTNLLLDRARQNPWVLDVPEPTVTFELFGADALQFRLYAWVGSGAVFLQTRDSLHREIDRAFRENGVNIAFSQRDVHLASAVPVPVQIVSETPDTHPT